MQRPRDLHDAESTVFLCSLAVVDCVSLLPFLKKTKQGHLLLRSSLAAVSRKDTARLAIQVYRQTCMLR